LPSELDGIWHTSIIERDVLTTTSSTNVAIALNQTPRVLEIVKLLPCPFKVAWLRHLPGDLSTMLRGELLTKARQGRNSRRDCNYQQGYLYHISTFEGEGVRHECIAEIVRQLTTSKW
jgi:hypothetical protein